MAENMQIKIDDNTKEVFIYQGIAPDKYEGKSVNITGSIDSVRNFLVNRKDLIDSNNAHINIDREKGVLTLIFDEKSQFTNTVRGSLTFSPEWESWGINGLSNEIKNYDPHALGDWIKMNRHCFSDRNLAMELVSKLKNFTANVSKELEKSDNNRGNKKVLIDQVIKTNIPEQFTLLMPIFKGQEKRAITVEIYINPDNLQVSLHSPEGKEIKKEEIDSIINEELKKIEVLKTGILLIEV